MDPGRHCPPTDLRNSLPGVLGRKVMLLRPLGGPTRSSCTALQCPPLIFAQAPPNTGVLVGIKGILQAVFGYRAVGAD
jgi:hypothetical protein